MKNAPTTAPMYTMRDVRERNAAAGSHWFEPDTIRFFRSRILGGLLPLPDGGGLFVSSERGPSGVRGYTVRRAMPDGNIETVGDFQAYSTARAAHRAADRIAAEVLQ